MRTIGQVHVSNGGRGGQAALIAHIHERNVRTGESCCRRFGIRHAQLHLRRCFRAVLQSSPSEGHNTELLEGYVGGIQITQGFVLVVAILMETAIAMVLLSRVLTFRPNRWANIVAGFIHTASVAGR